jgi:four helix bundle protein
MLLLCALLSLLKFYLKRLLGFVLGKQLIASGTSIAANVEEAQGAFSKDDFIYKMQIAFKEALETSLWLRLICDSGLVKNEELKILLNESSEVKKVLSAIVKSSKTKK